jgi:hypothetical protein
MAAPNGVNGAAIRFVWSRYSFRKAVTVTIVTKDSAFFLSQGLRDQVILLLLLERL